VASVWGVCMGVALLVVGKRYDIDFWTARSFYFLAGRVLDIQFEIEGEEHLKTKPAILLGNHQIFAETRVQNLQADVFSLSIYFNALMSFHSYRIFPRATVISAKKELRWVPFLGLFMMAGGNIFLDRRNPQVAIKSLRTAGETMKRRKLSLWVFPEGTRTLNKETDMKPFKKGAFHVAVQSGLPLVPVLCENYWKIYHQDVFGKGTLKIKILPPIETTGLTPEDVPDLAIRTREIMLKALHEISTPNDAPSTDRNARRKERDSSLMPPPPVPSADSKSIGITEIRPAGQASSAVKVSDSDSSRQRTPSLARSVVSVSDNGSQETEEEDGHVLDGRKILEWGEPVTRLFYNNATIEYKDLRDTMNSAGPQDTIATDHHMADPDETNPSKGNLNDKGDDYVYFNRSTAGFSDDVIPRAKAFQLKLEHYYKLAVEAAVQRNTRRVEIETKLVNDASMSDEKKRKQLAQLGKTESTFLRLRRTKIGLNDFRTVKLIGKGAFGEVRL
ncbi:6420_t:CDS:2, partial [Acaulospora colombiana]